MITLIWLTILILVLFLILMLIRTIQIQICLIEICFVHELVRPDLLAILQGEKRPFFVGSHRSLRKGFPLIYGLVLPLFNF